MIWRWYVECVIMLTGPALGLVGSVDGLLAVNITIGGRSGVRLI